VSVTGDIHELQARAEGVEVVGDYVEMLGRKFRIANRIGLMPLMRFAMLSKQGVQADDVEGLAAMYALIRDCIDTTRPQVQATDPETGQPAVDPETGQPVMEDAGPSEWDRFEAHAIDAKADENDLLKVVQDVIQVLSARPTRRPSDSSAGPQTTSPSSKAISSSTAPSPQRSAWRNAPADQDLAELVPIDDLIRERDERAARSTA
jgi:hypothetical protein